MGLPARRAEAAASLDAGDEATGDGASDVADSAECSVPAECPAPGNECVTRTCEGRVCGTKNVAAGTMTQVQTAGDCRVHRCDGSGGIATEIDDADIPDDGNSCASDTCTSGVAGHSDEPQGTACGGSR